MNAGAARRPPPSSRAKQGLLSIMTTSAVGLRHFSTLVFPSAQTPAPAIGAGEPESGVFEGPGSSDNVRDLCPPFSLP